MIVSKSVTPIVCGQYLVSPIADVLCKICVRNMMFRPTFTFAIELPKANYGDNSLILILYNK